MKKIFLLIIPVLLLLALQGCFLGAIKGSGVFIDEERTPDAAFTSVDSRGDFNVIIIKDSVRHLSIHGEDNIVPEITTNVQGGKLVIKYDDEKIRIKHKEITIRVYTPELSEMIVGGSGNIECEDNFIADDVNIEVSGSGNISHTGVFTSNSLKVKVSGSGNITSSADCSTVNAIISGSGKITLSGSSTTQSINISGSGDADLLAMPTQNSTITISGSGNCKVDVAVSMDVTISGSGSVSYKGNPILNIHSSGSGSVNHL